MSRGRRRRELSPTPPGRGGATLSRTRHFLASSAPPREFGREIRNPMNAVIGLFHLPEYTTLDP